jgi:hypothetical protein
MADKSNDPVAVWHNMLAEMEKGFNAFATQTMGSEQFSQAVHKVTGASVGAQKTVGDLMERYLVAMNLPSRAQMVGISERLQAIESQLNEIRAAIHRMEGGSAASDGSFAPKPPRTKLPPSATGGST